MAEYTIHTLSKTLVAEYTIHTLSKTNTEQTYMCIYTHTSTAEDPNRRVNNLTVRYRRLPHDIHVLLKNN